MLVIVVYHGCNNGPFDTPGRDPDVHLGSWLLFWATNAFVFISGWYGIRFSIQRFWRFLGLGAFAALVLFIASPVVLGKWKFTFTLGWFGNAYMALMLIAPIVNAAVESLFKQGERLLIGAWMGYTFAMLLSWMPTRYLGVDLGVPGWGGHTFNTLLYIYVSASVLHRLRWIERLSRSAASGLFIAAVTVHVVVLGMGRIFPVTKAIFGDAGDYNSPWMLVAGAMIFAIFLKTEFPIGLQRACGYLAPSMFSVYLLHTAANHAVCATVRNRFIMFVDRLLDLQSFHVISVVIASVLIFCACVVIDLCRRSVRNRCF